MMPPFRGHIDIVTPHYVEGWLANLAALDRPLDLEARLSSAAGVTLRRVMADRDRQDLRQAGIGSGAHGFRLPLGGLPAAEYQISFTLAGSDRVLLEIDRLTRSAVHLRPLVSQHIPKCAGTSLLWSLNRIYSPEQILRDSSDRIGDPASPYNIDPASWWENSARITTLGEKQVVHGHFHLHKYRNVANAVRITLLREPVERLISHYFFLKKTNDRENLLSNYVLDANLSLPQFARLPMIRAFYTKVFFKGVDMGLFDFIGTHEAGQDSLRGMSDLLGCPLAVGNENRNTDDSYRARKAAILDDRDLRRTLATLLADDIEFYHEVGRRMPWRDGGTAPRPA